MAPPRCSRFPAAPTPCGPQHPSASQARRKLPPPLRTHGPSGGGGAGLQPPLGRRPGELGRTGPPEVCVSGPLLPWGATRQPGAADQPEPAARAGRIKAAAQKAGAGAAGLPEHTDPGCQRPSSMSSPSESEGPKRRPRAPSQPCCAARWRSGGASRSRSSSPKPPLSPVAWLIPSKRRSKEG